MARAGMIERLAEDHVTARLLADGLADIPGSPRTLILSGSGPTSSSSGSPTGPAFLDGMAREGVLMVAYPQGYVRAVTHYGIEQHARGADRRGSRARVLGDRRRARPRLSAISKEIPSSIRRPARPHRGARPRDRRVTIVSRPWCGNHLDELLHREPVLATYLGIHDQDERLGDMSRAGPAGA